MFIITQTDLGVYLRVGRVPAGPTLTFRVNSFTLQRDIRASQKSPRFTSTDYQFSPLVVLNGFRQGVDVSEDGIPLQLVSTILTRLFPAIDVKKMQVGQCRRVVLFNYNKDTNSFEVRHYAVIKKPAGMTRGVLKLVRWSNQKILDLGRKQDVSEFVLSGGTGAASDSEGDELISVEVPRGTRQALAQTTNQIGIRLVELGPRLDLTLMKAEEELCGGTVLYQLNPEKSSN